MIDSTASEAADLAEKCLEKYGPYTSTHEAYGVLAEEVSELLDAIRHNNLVAVRLEAIDVAAVALKLASDIEENDGGDSPSAFAKRSGAK